MIGQGGVPGVPDRMPMSLLGFPSRSAHVIGCRHVRGCSGAGTRNDASRAAVCLCRALRRRWRACHRRRRVAPTMPCVTRPGRCLPARCPSRGRGAPAAHRCRERPYPARRPGQGGPGAGRSGKRGSPVVSDPVRSRHRRAEASRAYGETTGTAEQTLGKATREQGCKRMKESAGFCCQVPADPALRC